MDLFPNLKTVAITLRSSLSVSHNTWSGVLWDGSKLWLGPQYDINSIGDPVGGGDSFNAGLIFALITWPGDYQKALPSCYIGPKTHHHW